MEEKKEREEMIRWLRDRDAGMLLLGIAHLGKMAEFMRSDTNELDKKIKESTDTLVDFIQDELDKAREEGFRIMFEGLDNIARNSSEDFYEGVAIIKLRNEITRLYKLKPKEDGK